LAIRRSVLETGVRLDNLRRGEDHVCGFRCVLLGRVVSIPEVLVHRRVHESNLTAPLHDNLTFDEVRRQHLVSTREAVLVPGAMRRDLIQFVRDGTISELRARPLLSALAVHARKLKILRVSERLPVLRRWACLCDLHRLGISYRASIRMLLPVLAPRLEALRKRRQERLFAVAFRGQSMRSGLPIR
jgi:hypothetical protein